MGVFADVVFPADLASADELPVGPVSANVFLAVATRSTRPDHPSPSRAANESHTGTSRGPAIRRCTNLLMLADKRGIQRCHSNQPKVFDFCQRETAF